jgi:rod shape-determining protein MreC
MLTVRRWWGRRGLQVGLVALVLLVAWSLRQSRGGVIYELYHLLTLPFQSEQDTRSIALEDASLRELQGRLLELESQNQQLRQLLDYSSTHTEGIVAPIIGRSADHWWQQIILGRGQNDGVQVGDIVSGTGGLVGRVTHTTPNTSRVLLITDPNSQVGVTVSRTRVMGVMRGQAGNRAVMQFFVKEPNVQPGDTIATSSISQLFPAGLPIGQVESVDFRKSPAPEAVIELSSPIGYLEWVIVSKNTAPQSDIIESEMAE